MARGLLAAGAVSVAVVLVCADLGGAGVEASCGRTVAPAPSGLPAPVVLTTSCGRFGVGADGLVRFLGGRWLPVPPGSSWFMDLTWYRVEGGRLLVGSGERLLWRSRGRFTPAYGVGAIALSQDVLAFSFFAGQTATLYLARLGGAERPVARGETPLGWTRTGALVTLSTRGGAIRVRSAGGRLERTLARSVFNEVFDRASGALFYVAQGTLERFDGSRVRSLASLERLGLARRPELTPLSGLIVLRDSQRLVVLGADGSFVSSALLPRPRTRVDGALGALAADSAGDVAFTATRGNTARGSTGSEMVYLLPAGGRAARVIYRERVHFAVCERQSGLAWHGRWLLYSASEGYAAAVDTARPSRFVDLSSLVRGLPGMIGGGGEVFEASWSGASG
jgi:hypothetical protein